MTIQFQINIGSMGDNSNLTFIYVLWDELTIYYCDEKGLKQITFRRSFMIDSLRISLTTL